MVLSGIHGTYRGAGGKYDDLIDAVTTIPGTEEVGRAYLNAAAAHPTAERVLTGYAAVDIVANSGDATVMGLHDLAKDANPSMIFEISDPVGNPLDIVGGMVEYGGEAADYEGVKLLGSGVEGLGEFISDPFEGISGEADQEWYDELTSGGEPAADGEGAGNGSGADQGAGTETGTETERETGSSEGTETGTETETGREETSTPAPEDIDYGSVESNLGYEDRQALWEYFNDADATHQVEPDTVFLEQDGGVYEINLDGYSGDRDLDMLNESEAEYLSENLDRIVELWEEDPDRY